MRATYAWKKRAELQQIIMERGLPAGGMCRDHFVTQLVNDDNGWPQPVFTPSLKTSSIYSLSTEMIVINLKAASLPTRGERDILIARLINHKLGNIGPQSGVFENGDDEMDDEMDDENDEEMGDENGMNVDDSSDDDDIESDGDDDASFSIPSNTDPEQFFGEITTPFTNSTLFATIPMSQQVSSTMPKANQSQPRQLTCKDLLAIPNASTRRYVEKAGKVAFRPSATSLASHMESPMEAQMSFQQSGRRLLDDLEGSLVSVSLSQHPLQRIYTSPPTPSFSTSPKARDKSVTSMVGC
jgi:hypothetical protein